MRKVGFLEVGIFGSSLLVLGLVIWFIALTFFGSRNESEARLLVALGPAAAAVKPLQGIIPPPAVVTIPVAPSALQEAPKESPLPAASEQPGPEVPHSVIASETKQSNQDDSLMRSPRANALAMTKENIRVGSEPGPAIAQPQQQRLSQESGPSSLSPQPQLSQQISNASEVPALKPRAPQPISATPEASVVKPQENVPPVAVAESQVQKEVPAVPEQTALDVKKTEIPPEAKQQELAAVDFKPASLRDPTLSPEESRAIEKRRKEQELKAKKEHKVVAEAKRVLNPFESLKRKIEVQGVLHSDDGILAIVNNQILHKGDDIFGARILQILGNRVIFKYQNKIFEKNVKQ